MEIAHGKKQLRNGVAKNTEIGYNKCMKKEKQEEHAGEKDKGGRPTKFDPKYCEQVVKLCKLGATDKDLADFFDVSEATINNWKVDFPKFLESLKEGRDFADANVADRLYQRAMGYEHDSEEIMAISDGKGAGSHVERVPIRKIYPPDSTAAIFWLKNRQKKHWRDTIDHTTGGDKLPTAPSFLEVRVISDAAGK